MGLSLAEELTGLAPFLLFLSVSVFTLPEAALLWLCLWLPMNLLVSAIWPQSKGGSDGFEDREPATGALGTSTECPGSLQSDELCDAESGPSAYASTLAGATPPLVVEGGDEHHTARSSSHENDTGRLKLTRAITVMRLAKRWRQATRLPGSILELETDNSRSNPYPLGRLLVDQRVDNRIDALRHMIPFLNGSEAFYLQSVIPKNDHESLDWAIKLVKDREGIKRRFLELVLKYLPGTTFEVEKAPRSTEELREKIEVVRRLIDLCATSEQWEEDPAISLLCYAYDLIYTACTARSDILPEGSKTCYEAFTAGVEEFLEAHVAIRLVKDDLDPDYVADTWKLFLKWLQMWSGVFSYLDRYYVKHNSLAKTLDSGLASGRACIRERLERTSQGPGGAAEGGLDIDLDGLLKGPNHIEHAPPITILLKSEKDGGRVSCSWEAAQCIGYIKSMAAVGKLPQEISLNVSTGDIEKAVEFINHHLAQPMDFIEKPLKSSNMHDCVQKWYADFVSELDQEALFELILAANSMDIPELLALTCASVASMIKDKTPEQIRQTFNITNDFTPEEEARVREDNRWCEET